MRRVSPILAAAIIVALSPSAAGAKSAVSRAQSKYAHEVLAAARTKQATPVAAATVPIAETETKKPQ